MGEMVVNIGVDKSEIADLLGMVDDATDVEVQHEPGACAPCRANNDPALIPFPGCRGQERHAKARGYGCRCRVVLKHSV